MSFDFENEKNDIGNELKIQKNPSINISHSLERSFSDSSIQSYKKYTDLLSINQIERINISNSRPKINNVNYKTNIKNIYYPNLDFKNLFQSSNKEIYNNNNNIIQKIKELKELSNNNFNNLTSRNSFNYNNKILLKNPNKIPNQFISKMEYMKNKNETSKIFFGENSKSLQKKEKKLLTGLISSKFKEQDDIEKFKNQFEIGNKSPFGCLDFQKKFKISFNVNNQNKFTKL